MSRRTILQAESAPLFGFLGKKKATAEVSKVALPFQAETSRLDAMESAPARESRLGVGEGKRVFSLGGSLNRDRAGAPVMGDHRGVETKALIGPLIKVAGIAGIGLALVGFALGMMYGGEAAGMIANYFGVPDNSFAGWFIKIAVAIVGGAAALMVAKPVIAFLSAVFMLLVLLPSMMKRFM